MGRFGFSLLVYGVFGALAFLSGDRYGAPGWLTSVTGPVFDRVEDQLGGQPAIIDFDEGEPASDTSDDEDSDAEEPVGDLPENANLKINDDGLEIIRQSEGLALEAYASGDHEYIGYGHRLAEDEPRSITMEQAEVYLRQDVLEAEQMLRRVLERPANESQFSAMGSLAYNLGGTAFSRSPVLMHFNAGEVARAADAFYTHNLAGGIVFPPLEERREKERALFLKLPSQS